MDRLGHLKWGSGREASGPPWEQGGTLAASVLLLCRFSTKLLWSTVVKHLPVKQEMWVPSLGREDPLEKKTAIHSSILAWNPMDRGAWQAAIHRVSKSRTQLSD